MRRLTAVRGAAPMSYDHAKDWWYLDTDESLPAHALRSAVDYCLRINEDRWRSTPPGDRKELFARGLNALKMGRVSVRIAKKRGDINLFTATTKQSTATIFNGA